MSAQDPYWKAAVMRSMYGFERLDVVLWRKDAGAFHYVEPTDLVIRRLEPGEEGTERRPSLQLDDDMGRALLDALSAHYGGTSDVRRLAADLDLKRGRVDKFIDYMIKERSA